MQQPVIITTQYLPPNEINAQARLRADSTIGYSVTLPRDDFSKTYVEAHREVAEALALQIALRRNTSVEQLVDLTANTDPGEKTAQYRFQLDI